jgi:hypothetical protein
VKYTLCDRSRFDTRTSDSQNGPPPGDDAALADSLDELVVAERVMPNIAIVPL